MPLLILVINHQTMNIRLLILVLFITTLTCCKKDTTSPDPQGFGYVLNSVAFDWDLPFGSNLLTGATILRYPVPNGLKDTIYLLQAWDQSKKIAINLAIPTKTLTTGTYKTLITASPGTTSSDYISNGIQYVPINLGDSTQVTITSISNNYATGSFKALMHDFSTKSIRLDIGNGYFNHLAISQ